MAIDSAPSAARVATKMIRTSRVAADRPRMIPRTLTIPSWLPRMKSERTVGFGCVARSLAMFASMAGPSRGTGKPFSLETSRSYGPAAAVVCPGPSRSAEGCSRTEAYKPPLVSGTVRPRRHARPAAEDPMANFRIENVVASTSLGRELARARCGRIRAGAVPGPRLSDRRAEGRPPDVRQRQGRLHGSPQARGRREGRREDHGRTQGERTPALIRRLPVTAASPEPYS